MQRNTFVGSGGVGTGTLGNAVGDTGGEEDVTLTGDNMPAQVARTSATVMNSMLGSGTATFVAGTGGTWTAGAETPLNNMQPSAVVLICIKATLGSSAPGSGNVGDFVDFGGTVAPDGCLVRDG